MFRLGMHSRARATHQHSRQPDSVAERVRLRAPPRFGIGPRLFQPGPFPGKVATAETVAAADAERQRGDLSETTPSSRRRRARAWVAVEVAVAAGVLVWATNPRVGLDPPDAELVRAGWWAAYAAVAGVAVPRWRALADRLRREPAIVGLVIVAWLSVGWTALPAFTAGGRWHLAGTTLVALWLAARFSPLAITALVGSAVALASTVSLGLLAADVSWAAAVDGYEAGWTGVWPHRNQAGIRAAVGAVALGGIVAAMMATPGWPSRHRKVAIAGVLVGTGACLAMALGSRSATVSVVLAVALTTGAAIGLRRLARRGGRARRFAVTVTGLGALGVLAAVVERSLLLELLNRRPDVTGRTDLWAALWGRVTDWPVVGHGYNAFWAGSHGPSAGIWEAFNGPPHAHNGYLDVLLELGVVGLVLLLLVVGGLVARTSVAVWRRPTPAVAAPALLVVALLLHAWSSSPLFAGRNVFWIALAALALSTGRHPTGPELPPARGGAARRAPDPSSSSGPDGQPPSSGVV